MGTEEDLEGHRSISRFSDPGYFSLCIPPCRATVKYRHMPFKKTKIILYTSQVKIKAYARSNSVKYSNYLYLNEGNKPAANFFWNWLKIENLYVKLILHIHCYSIQWKDSRKSSIKFYVVNFWRLRLNTETPKHVVKKTFIRRSKFH